MYVVYVIIYVPIFSLQRWTYLTTPKLRKTHPDYDSKYDSHEKTGLATIFGFGYGKSEPENGVALKVMTSKKAYEEDQEEMALAPPAYETHATSNGYAESSKLMA